MYHVFFLITILTIWRIYYANMVKERVCCNMVMPYLALNVSDINVFLCISETCIHSFPTLPSILFKHLFTSLFFCFRSLHAFRRYEGELRIILVIWKVVGPNEEVNLLDYLPEFYTLL